MKIYNFSNIVDNKELNELFKTFRYLDSKDIKLYILHKNKYISILLEYILIFIHFYKRTSSFSNHQRYNGYISYAEKENTQKKQTNFIIIYTYHLTSKIDCINKLNLLSTLIHELRHHIQFKKNLIKHCHLEKQNTKSSQEYRIQPDELDAEKFMKHFLNKNQILIEKIFNIKYTYFALFNKKTQYTELFFKNK